MSQKIISHASILGNEPRDVLHQRKEEIRKETVETGHWEQGVQGNLKILGKGDPGAVERQGRQKLWERFS